MHSLVIKISTKIVIVFSLLVSSLAVAQEVEQAKISVMSAANILQVVLSLLFIVLLIFALAWYMRRVQNISVGNASKLRVLASLAVGTRERVVLIQVGDEQVLLGVAAGRVNHIKTLGTPIVETNDLQKPQGFLKIFSEVTSRQNKN